MTKLNIVLLLALMASGQYQVRVTYESRRLYNELDRARNEEKILEAESRRLDAEREAQATHLRVEKVARDKLKMRTATPAVTMYVTDAAASGAMR